MTAKKQKLGADGKPLKYPNRSHRVRQDKEAITKAYMDRRTVTHKVLRGQLDQLVADLGGEDALSYQQFDLAERAVVLGAVINKVEHRLLTGEGELLGSYSVLINTLTGLYRTLGIERRAKPVSLQDVIDNHGEDAR